MVTRKAKASEDELRALVDVLKISKNNILGLSDAETLTAELGPRWYPNRGIGPIPPTDPVIYRLFEASYSRYASLYSLRLCVVEGRACLWPCHQGTLIPHPHSTTGCALSIRIGPIQAVIHEKVSRLSACTFSQVSNKIDFFVS